MGPALNGSADDGRPVADPASQLDALVRLHRDPIAIGVRSLAGPLPPPWSGDPVAGPHDSDRRRAELRHGRALARDCLARLGAEPIGIPRGADRSPTWPTGIVGSISHTDEVVMVAVGRRSAQLLGLGVDAERVGAIDESVASIASTGREHRLLDRWSGEERALATTVSFCVKEAVFKACFGLDGRWLEFDDVEVSLGELDGVATATISGSAPGVLTIRWVRSDAHVFAVVLLASRS